MRCIVAGTEAILNSPELAAVLRKYAPAYLLWLKSALSDSKDKDPNASDDEFASASQMGAGSGAALGTALAAKSAARGIKRSRSTMNSATEDSQVDNSAGSVSGGAELEKKEAADGEAAGAAKTEADAKRRGGSDDLD